MAKVKDAFKAALGYQINISSFNHVNKAIFNPASKNTKAANQPSNANHLNCKWLACVAHVEEPTDRMLKSQKKFHLQFATNHKSFSRQMTSA